MSGNDSSTITPRAKGGTGGPSAGTPQTSPNSTGLTALIAASTNPPVGFLGATMYCNTPKKLASVVGPMIASQLGKDAAEISDLLVDYLSSHGIDNDKCLAAVHDGLPDPTANEGDQGEKILTLPSTKMLRKIACGVQLAVENSQFLQRGTTYEEISKILAATTHPGNISGAQAMSNSNSSTVSFSGSSTRIPKVSIPSYKKFEPDDSEKFLDSVESAFASEGMSKYLTDHATNTLNPDTAKAFCSRILFSFSDSTTQKYLKEQWKGSGDVSVLWRELNKHFRHPLFERSARSKLWDRILRLECTDLSDFTRWYSDINEIVTKLTALNSVAVTDEELLCSFVARGLDVTELKEEHKKFLKPTNLSFKDMLDNLREDYRAQEGKEESSTATAGSSRTSRRAKQAADSKPTKFPNFPRNRNNVCDPTVYAQFKAFYQLSIKPDRTAAEQKEVDNFVIAPAPAESKWKKKTYPDKGNRDRNDRGGYQKKPPRDGGRRSDKRRDSSDYADKGSYRSSRRSHRDEPSRSRDRSYSRSRSRSRPRSASRDRRDRSRSRDRSPERSTRRANRSTKRSHDRSEAKDSSRNSRRTMFSGKADPNGKGTSNK